MVSQDLTQAVAMDENRDKDSPRPLGLGDPTWDCILFALFRVVAMCDGSGASIQDQNSVTDSRTPGDPEVSVRKRR